MSEKNRPIAPYICFVVGLFTIAASNTAHAAECFSGPDVQPGPGTRWHYRIDQTTNQGCWYLKKVRESSRRPGEVVRDNEPTSLKKHQWSKSEQQSKVSQRESERGQSEAARVQHRSPIPPVSVLEAAGDKPVPNPPIMLGQDLQKAIEAVGDKDPVTPPTTLAKDWQKALYEEFLRWRHGQLMPQ